MSKRSTLITIALTGGALFGFGLMKTVTRSVYGYHDSRVVAREADHASGFVQTTHATNLTFEQARDWLQQSGFRIVYWNPNSPDGYVGSESGKDGRFTIVYGQKNLRSNGLLSEAKWANVWFRFRADGSFHDVKSGTSSYQIGISPRTRSATSQSSGSIPGTKSW